MDPIFVFGSNLAGRHGAGAARFALQWRGAVAGQGEGPYGDSYALPTKDAELRPLPLARVRHHIEDFLTYAELHPELKFQVTRVGCGLAGFKDEQIAPLFFDAPDNCYLPGIWEAKRRLSISPEEPVVRLIIAGSRTITLSDNVYPYLDHVTSFLSKPFTVVSGGAEGVDYLGEKWAASQKLHVRKFAADWDRYGKSAGPIRNALMAWYGTHLVAIWDGESRGTANMIDIAQKSGLTVKIRKV